MPSKVETQIETAEQEWLKHWKQGPTRLRWNRIPLQVGDKAVNLRLDDTAGGFVQLRDAWKDGPALLLFWRHYGCSCGIERAKRLQTEYADYAALGAKVIGIGQGEPERTAAYALNHNIPCPMQCDPTRSA